MKRKLNEVHMAAVDGLLARGKSANETVALVAKQFDLLPKSVQQYAESKLAEQPVIPNTPVPLPDPMINKTASGREGVMVMTEAGSNRVDAARERNKSIVPKVPSHIHKARG